ncbi:GNAT family N-acetyltransferase [Streptomyces uncialis]|uniref:GNAT family N-acetyltransferase n=1 Tax=Streptomyces uncialis TaxID=1048205 RepID=UPI003828EBB8
MTTPKAAPDAVVRTCHSDQVPPLLDVIAGIWAESHLEFDGDPAAEAAGLSVDALRRQVTGHLKHPGFTLTVAHSGGAAVGFGYAFLCSADYWFGPDLVDRVPEAARTERLMGLCELAVQPDWQGRGIGSLLHAELIASTALPPRSPERGPNLLRPLRRAADGTRSGVGCTLPGTDQVYRYRCLVQRSAEGERGGAMRLKENGPIR